MANIDIQMQDYQGNIIHPQTNAKVVEYKGSNVSSAIDSLVDREELFIQETEPINDGFWIDTSEIVTSTTEENIIATQIKKYIDEKVTTKVDKVESSNTDILAKIGNTTSLETDVKDNLVDAVNEHEVQINNNTKQVSNLSNPNLLINGDFRVWQRGTSFEFTKSWEKKYTADRWFGDQNTTFGKIIKHEKGVQLELTTSNVGQFHFMNILDEFDTKKLLGKTVTLSYKISDIVGSWVSICQEYKGNWKQFYNTTLNVTGEYSYTFKIDETLTSSNLRVLFGTSSSSVSGDKLLIEWVKLELGAVATPFISRPYAEELALCQRYYEVIDHEDFCYTGLAVGTNALGFSIPFKVTKRVAPTLKLRHKSATVDGDYVVALFAGDNTASNNVVCTLHSSRTGGARFEIKNPSGYGTLSRGTPFMVFTNVTIDAEIY